VNTMHRNVLTVSTLLALSLSVTLARGADKKTIIEQTNRAYYNLKARGFVGLDCEVMPDWEPTLSGFTSDAAARKQVLPLVKQIKFQVAVGTSGAASVSHQFSQAPPSEEAAEGLRQVSEGIEQVISGFFQTWSQLMVNPPISDEFQMEETSDGYRFTSDAAKTHAVMLVQPNFVIKSIEAKTPEFEGTVYPQFVAHEGGLVPASYQSSIKLNGAAAQQVSVKVQYQDVDSLTLPLSVSVSVMGVNGLLTFPMTFSHCQVKKK
jgi:hypothetical protein